MFYTYPIIVCIFCGVFIIAGFILRNRKLVAMGTLASCFTASPMLTFTRGAAGAVIASDIVGWVLLVSMILFPSLANNDSKRVSWVAFFWALILIIIISIIFVGPIYNTFNMSLVHVSRVRAIGGVPLSVLMAGFRLFKVIGLIAIFMYFSRVNWQKKEFDHVIDLILFLFLILAVAEIMTRLGIVNLSLAVNPDADYSGPRVMGFTKATISRLCVVGMFLAIMRMYKSFSILKGLLISVLLLSILMSGSRGALLAIAVGIMLILYYGKLGGLVVFLAVITVFIGGVYLVDSLNEEVTRRLLLTFDPDKVRHLATRKDIWLLTLQYWYQHPLVIYTGVGAMNFAYAVKLTDTVAIEHSHNDFLTSTTELGVIGLIVFCLYLFKLINRFHGRIMSTQNQTRWENVCLTAMLIGLATASLFEPTFYINVNTLPMVCVINSVMVMYEISYNNRNTKDYESVS